MQRIALVIVVLWNALQLIYPEVPPFIPILFYYTLILSIFKITQNSPPLLEFYTSNSRGLFKGDSIAKVLITIA